MSEVPPDVLSDREMEVLHLVAQGFSNKEIARELFISANTVKVHLRNIFGKLEVNSRTEASMVAVRQGWVSVDAETPKDAATSASGAVEPLALWQRVFLLAALIAVVFMLVWSLPLSTPLEEKPENPLVDNVEAVAVIEPPSLPTRWQEEVPISIARDRLAVVAVDGIIYAIGGETSGGVTGAVEAYAPTQQAWTLKATKPVPVANIGGAVLGGKVYVPGGLTFSGLVTDVVEVYDPATDRWEEADPLPVPRAAYALAVHGSKLYLFGGNDGQRDVTTVLIYDPVAKEWQILPGRPPARAFLAASTLDDAIYVLGGYADGRELDTCQVYLPMKNQWGSCAPMLEGRGGLSLVAVGHQLWAIGGGWEDYLAYNQWYDPSKDAWFRFETPVLDQWRNAGAAELGGRVYVIGGWSKEFLNVNLTYQAIWKAFIPSLSR
jgi:DNA-binding CsgD family transcriptional regulator/N-acetylneuraminic acid mutarotase